LHFSNLDRIGGFCEVQGDRAVAEFVKAIVLAAAFLFWAANQLWPDLRQATLFNDIAIALFVLDVLLVMIGWPVVSPGENLLLNFRLNVNDEPQSLESTLSAPAAEAFAQFPFFPVFGRFPSVRRDRIFALEECSDARRHFRNGHCEALSF
jgi:hypothetical protein